MRFGIFDNVELRHDVGLTSLYDDLIDFVVRAEECGVDYYHISEHHNMPLSLAASPAVMYSAIAQRTKRIRFAPLVFVLPCYNPFRLIEEICMVDHMSGGRMEVGVGRGVDRAIDIRNWGMNAAENNAIFDESLDLLLKGLQGGEFLTYHGKYFNTTDLWMPVRPLQKPCPPFWWPGNPQHAGERGMNFVGGRESIPETAKTIETFRKAYDTSPAKELAGPNGPLYGDRKHVFVTPTDAEALDRARTAYSMMTPHYRKPLPSEVAGPEFLSGPGKIPFEVAMEREAFLAGSPGTVRDYLKRYEDETGANYFVGVFRFGDLTHRESVESLTLFASEVMPALSRVAV